MDHNTLLATFMDQDNLVLGAELVALFLLCALGIWRIRRHQQELEDARPAPQYDMRRDGERRVPSA